MENTKEDIKEEVIDKTHRAIYRKHAIFYMNGWYPQRRVLGMFWRNMRDIPFPTMRQAERFYSNKPLKLKK